MSIITAVSPLPALKISEVECIDCGEWLPKSEAIYCNCEPPDLLPVCEECYTLHKHYLSDTNPENDWRRGQIQMSHERTKNN